MAYCERESVQQPSKFTKYHFEVILESNGKQ